MAIIDDDRRPDPAGPDSSDGAEDTKERVDRELMELLQELRVALPGVQVLFAFLLTVPFTQAFERLSAGDRRIYFVAVLATAVASILLIAPTAHHRLRFRDGVKEQLLRGANIFALLGLASLGVGMAAAVWVITDVVYASTVARVVTALLVALLVVVWLVVPFTYRPAPAPPRR